MKEIDRGRIRKILVIRTDRMGDALLNIPAIRALKQSFRADIFALVNPGLKQLLSGVKEIDHLLAFDENKWKKNLLARLRILWQLRREKFDLAVILNPARRFHILTYLSGVPYRLGYDRKWGFLLTHRIEDKKYLAEKHEVEYNLDLVRRIGADTPDKHISINADPEDQQFINELLLKYGITDNSLLIAIHPFSSNPDKCWPGEDFIHVAEDLIARFSARIAIIGGPEQRAQAFKLLGLTKQKIIDLVGKLSLKQLAAFFQKCSLLISNDSGPVHIAAAVGTACLVIFGRNIPGTGPQRWAPWGEGHIVLHKESGDAISPEEVIEAASKKINAYINR